MNEASMKVASEMSTTTSSYCASSRLSKAATSVFVVQVVFAPALDDSRALGVDLHLHMEECIRLRSDAHLGSLRS